MNPDQLAKSTTEHGHQRALFAWAVMAQRCGFAAAWDMDCYTVRGHADEQYAPWGPVAVHCLEWFHAIPNGGALGNDRKTNAIRGKQKKDEGVKAGVSDTFLPHPRSTNGLTPSDWEGTVSIAGIVCGLYLEMKKPGKIKTTSKEQRQFHMDMRRAGYCTAVADNWRDAAAIIQLYITGSRP